MWVEKLQTELGRNKVSDSESDLFRHSKDESSHQRMEPDVVCFPESTDDVVMIVNIARTYRIPVTPYGVGSGLEGQAIPIQKGISVSFERMNRIVDFQFEDLTITVEAGVTRKQLNEYVNRYGLMFPIDPGADASIGGMVATNASGTTAVRYGSMRDQLLDLEVVTIDGEVIHTGTRAKKSSSGYHLTGLFAGSEGTLGLITKITLKLHGIPEHIIAARCTFPTLEACTEAAQTILWSGIPMMRMELVDANSLAQVNAYGSYDYPVKHSLFLQFAGTKGAVKEEAKFAEELMHERGCDSWEASADSNERKQLWKARHEMSYAFRHQKGMSVLGGDVCVPISKLPKLITDAHELLHKSGLNGGILGHIGDGNFHTLISYHPRVYGEKEKAEQVHDVLTRKAIEVGGTCTGEHGVGLGKMKFQEQEHGLALRWMKAVKHLFDPEGLFNPGKIFL